MSGYNTISDDSFPAIDRPLFGQATLWDKVINVVTLGVTGLFVVITLLGAFIQSGNFKGVNVFFAICLTVYCLTHDILIYWYRQGDVDPKFRLLIYSNTLVIFMQCICANLYIYM